MGSTRTTGNGQISREAYKLRSPHYYRGVQMFNPTQNPTQTNHLRLTQRSILEAIFEILEFMDKLEEPDARLVALLVRLKYEDKFGKKVDCHEG